MRVQEVLESAGLQESEDMIAAVIADQLAAVRQTLDRTDGWSPGESELLRAGGLDPAPLTQREVDALMTEVAATYARLAASSLSVVEAARVLEVDSSRVRQRLTERTLHGFKLRRQWRIPAWQFVGGREIPGLSEVLPQVTVHDPVSVYEFLSTPTLDLATDGEPITALQWLSAGRPPARVREIAAALTRT